jgi:hypothetical protein
MNQPSKQGLLHNEQEDLQMQRHQQQTMAQNLQRHHHQSTTLWGCESWALKT